MKEYEILESIGDFRLAREIHDAIVSTIPEVQKANLSKFGAISNRLSKKLEPIITSRIHIPEGFSYKLQIEKQTKGKPAGRQRIRWDALLRVREFITHIYIRENIFRFVFEDKDSIWVESLTNMIHSALVHELVHLNQMTNMVQSLLKRGFTDHKYLDISDKIVSKEYLDRPIEAHAFAIEHAISVFFKIARQTDSIPGILEALKQVRRDVPREFRSPNSRLLMFRNTEDIKTDYNDPYDVFEGNPYTDRLARNSRSISDQTRKIYLKTFTKTLDKIISEVQSTSLLGN